MNGNNTYQERNRIPNNQGEDIFLAYCKEHNLKATRLGFDEKQHAVDRFYDLPPFIRNLPDFVVTSEKKLILVNVKGTYNFKEKEFELLEGFGHLYDSENSPLYYAFCTRPDKVVWRKLEAVQKAYVAEREIKTWPDGQRYKTLGWTNA